TDWKIFGKTRDEIRAAAERRRRLTPEDQIVVAGTPSLAMRYEVKAQPVAESPSRSTKTARADTAATGPDLLQPLESAASELKGALEIERGHGRRLLDALGDMGLARNWRYHRPAKGSDVDGWEASIDHLLRDRNDLRDLFHYEPLEPAIRGFLPSLSDGLLHGPERRRLKQRLNQLDRVVERV
ncbi:MAG TPA: hypothetical protein VMR96_02355, partial [Solirubrobacterales bacterium]|nr:hypothetical protein [Solirubrobacterales bacterium]